MDYHLSSAPTDTSPAPRPTWLSSTDWQAWSLVGLLLVAGILLVSLAGPPQRPQLAANLATAPDTQLRTALTKVGHTSDSRVRRSEYLPPVVRASRASLRNKANPAGAATHLASLQPDRAPGEVMPTDANATTLVGPLLPLSAPCVPDWLWIPALPQPADLALSWSQCMPERATRLQSITARTP
jgi:hypothetical protein